MRTAVPESIKDERVHLDSAITIVEPRLSKLGNHRSAALAGHRSPGPGPGSWPRQLRSWAKSRDKPYHVARLGPA